MLTKEEWWDVCRKIQPDLSWEEFERDWEEFMDARARRAAN